MCLLPYLVSVPDWFANFCTQPPPPPPQKKEKHCLKLLLSISYASDSILHKSFTHREKEKNNETYINVEFLATYKLFLQHSFKVTVSPFLQTPLKSN